jgi:hypothetical protein
VPHELTKLEREAIVTHFKGLWNNDPANMQFFEFNLPGRCKLFIKYSDDILAEASTQHFFHCLANGNESAPRIPRVFDAFCSEEGHCLMAMEKIVAPTLSDSDVSEEEAVEYAASAVKWLLDQLPYVPDTSFGRISSEVTPVWHQFFKDHRAPRAFGNSNELTEYVLKVSIMHF